MCNYKSIRFRDQCFTDEATFWNQLDKIYVSGCNPTEIASDYNELYIMETYLYQQQEFLPNGSKNNFRTVITPTPQRRYSMEDIWKANDFLDILDFLERLNFKDTLTIARSLLNEFQHCRYELRNILKEISKQPSQQATILDNTFRFEYGNQPKSYFPYPKLCASMRMKYNEYLQPRTVDAENPPKDFHLFVSERLDKKTGGTRIWYYLPVDEIPEFLLVIAFIDGRDFRRFVFPSSNNTANKLPRFNSGRSRSLSSYKTVLEQINKAFLEHGKNEYPVHLFRLDKIFYYAKLNCMRHYYMLYTSDLFLNQIMHYYSLSYTDTLIMKETLISAIFNNADYIICGLQSHYLDFMLPFDIFFQTKLFVARTCSEEYKGIEGMKKDIQYLIQKAINILSHPVYHLSGKNCFIKNESGHLDIQSSKKACLDELFTNPFYKEFFAQENHFINDILSDCTPYVSYDMIKASLPN